MTTLGCIGQGFVGNALTQAFRKYFEVLTYDKKFSDMTVYKNKDSYQIRKQFPIKELVRECSIIFVCVPTPMNPDGSCNILIVNGVLNELEKECFYQDRHVNVVIKSTIPPGSTEAFNKNYPHLNVCFNPEFLREVSAEEDYKNQKFIIAGGKLSCVKMLRDICKEAFPEAVFYECASTMAELVKYTINCYLAVKVSFANEIKQLCDSLGVSYSAMINIAQLDSRLGDSHWQVPGYDRLLGFGGSCFPKDLNGLINVMIEKGIDPMVLQAAWTKNLEVRPERDWENLVGRAVIGRTNDEQKERVA